jgi:hypothetical protein
MSYLGVNPGWYQMTAPDTVLSAGSKGWSEAPWVDWGDNPNTAGGPRLAVGAFGETKPVTGLLDPSLVAAAQPAQAKSSGLLVTGGLFLAAAALIGAAVYMVKKESV